MVSAASLLRHLGVPALGPLSIVVLYFTPVTTFGCLNRGLMAVAVVLVSTTAAMVTMWIGVRKPSRDTARALWMLSTVILLMPAALLVGPLG